MSDDEATALRSEGLATEAVGYGLTDAPQVALIRWTSHADWGQMMAQCLQDAGFNVQGAGSTILFPDGVGPAQQSALNLASYVCDSKYSMHPKYTQPFTADQFGVWYDYDVEWLVPCLATLGVTVSTAPTRETFIAQGLQNGSPDWDPFGEAGAEFSASWQKDLLLNQTCPAYPSPQYMWG